MEAEIHVLTRCHRLLHHGVHRLDHRRCATARVIAAQQIPAQPLNDEGLCGLEHLGFGAPEAVNRLLGIANQKHAGRFARPGARIGGQPAVQRLPLQRIGVLEFVDEQLAHTGIHALLHPARELGIPQQPLGCGLQIVHVDPAAFPLELGVDPQQHPGQAREALVVHPGAVLIAGFAQTLQLRFCGLRRVVLRQVLAQAVFAGHKERLAQHRQTLNHGAGLIGQRKSIDHFVRGLLGCFEWLAAQSLGPGEPALPHGIAEQRGFRFVHRGQIGPEFGEGLDRGLDHTAGVRHGEFDALLQRVLQRLEGLMASVFGHAVEEVLMFLRRVEQRLVQARPDQRRGALIVFEQLVRQWQSKLFQHRQRRPTQQGREPAVEGSDLHPSAGGQHAVVESAQILCPGRSLLGAEAPGLQQRNTFRIAQSGAAAQLALQALAHLASSFFGEGDGEDVLRRCAGQQGPNDAGDQHPGLARARTGFHRHGPGRIAGHGVKGVTAGGLAIDAVGRGHVRAHAALQSSRRQRPRAAQCSHTRPSPNAGMA